MNARTIRQRNITTRADVYRDMQRARRANLQRQLNAVRTSSEPVVTSEHSPFMSFMGFVLGTVVMVIAACQIDRASAAQQAVRDAQNACKAQGLSAVVLTHNDLDEVFCTGDSQMARASLPR